MSPDVPESPGCIHATPIMCTVFNCCTFHGLGGAACHLVIHVVDTLYIFVTAELCCQRAFLGLFPRSCEGWHDCRAYGIVRLTYKHMPQTEAGSPASTEH